MTLDDLRQILFQYQDTAYADFTAKLIPTVPREKFIGVRSPAYKPIVKQVRDDPVIPEFLASLPHTWHEENCLHAALINGMKDYGSCVAALEQFMPFIDNWAVNDMINPACFRKHRAELIHPVQKWIASDATYTRRCGMRILMANFLGEDFRPAYLDLPADLRSEEYYVNIMTAWLFAEALVKQWDAAVPYIETRRLDPWTHNKTIQKACESFRIPDDRKAYLQSLKVKRSREAKGNPARVEKYERLFDEVKAAPDQEKLRLLEAYYTSGEWQEDYEADERGEFPPELKRGVLSQDALYDLLDKVKEDQG
jgi:hypothetical protein